MNAIQTVLDDEQKEQFNHPVPIELKSRRVAFHHPLMVHGSHANRTERPRQATVLNVVRDGVCSESDDPLLAGVDAIPKGQRLDGQFYPLLLDPNQFPVGNVEPPGCHLWKPAWPCSRKTHAAQYSFSNCGCTHRKTSQKIPGHLLALCRQKKRMCIIPKQPCSRPSRLCDKPVHLNAGVTISLDWNVLLPLNPHHGCFFPPSHRNKQRKCGPANRRCWRFARRLFQATSAGRPGHDA